MAQYDSDSSFEDDDASGVATNVLLGYASTEPTEDDISHLGGEPSWIDESQPPSATLAHCANCNTHMPLLLQLNGALPDRFPGHERRLYIWGCPKRRCRRKEGTVRAIRGVKVDPSRAKQASATTKEPEPKETELKKQQQKLDIGGQLFGGAGGSAFQSSGSSNANPFSTSSGTSNANPFSNSSTPSTLANPFSSSSTNSISTTSTNTTQNESSQADAASTLPQTFAQKARISEPKAKSTDKPQEDEPQEESVPWPTSGLPEAYPKYHLDADYEYLGTTEPKANGSSKHYEALMDIDTNSGGGGGAGEKEKDLFESEHDKTFQHFADTLSQNPEQVLRYEFGGIPLLYSRVDTIGKLLSGHQTHSNSKVSSRVSTIAAPGVDSETPSARIPRCKSCGSARAFEVQLTPAAIAELEADQEPAKILNEGMEWGAIIVGVCTADCVPSNAMDGKTIAYREEWCGVQWEEEVVRRDGGGGASGSGSGSGSGSKGKGR